MIVAGVLAAWTITAQPAGPVWVNVAPGPAPASINRLAAQAGVDVVIAVDLHNRQTHRLTGRMNVETAFDRLLRPVGARAVRVGFGQYRIEAAPPPHRLAGVSSARPPAPDPPAAPEPTELSDVVVTAMPPVGVRETALAHRLDPAALQRASGSPASEVMADLTASVDSTRLGFGRNKLFVRGMADSAINGQRQATTGVYFGELRLGGGSPDPDIALVDVRRIEVFEGPQGSRFGLGSIGGVVRILPQEPELGAAYGLSAFGVQATSGGAPGGDAAVIVNAALTPASAVRMVAWARRDGGFLNDRRSDAFRDDVDTVGGRLAVRWRQAGWTADVTALSQQTQADDAQTMPADISSPPGQPPSPPRVLEPYRSSIVLGGLTLRRDLGHLRLAWANSLSGQTLAERFDAGVIGRPFPRAVDRDQSARSLSSELRFDFADGRRWSYAGGAALTVSRTRTEARHRDGSPAPLPETDMILDRRQTEAAVFGEASAALGSEWRLALGGRLAGVRIATRQRSDGAPLPDRSWDDEGVQVAFTPSASARWNVSESLTLFARLDQAIRPAGSSEASGAFERYGGDRVTLFEAGARTRDGSSIFAEASLGWIDWRDIQADTVTQGGDLVVANIGDGEIRFASLKASWRVTEELDISGSMFFNDSLLTIDAPNLIGVGSDVIPNVASTGAQFSLDYVLGEWRGEPVRLGADLRYVGASRFGVGPQLDVPHGGYLRAELTARVGGPRRALSLRISNPFDIDGTRYGIGSPYRLYEPETVPLRPMSVRLGFESDF